MHPNPTDTPHKHQDFFIIDAHLKKPVNRAKQHNVFTALAGMAKPLSRTS